MPTSGKPTEGARLPFFLYCCHFFYKPEILVPDTDVKTERQAIGTERFRVPLALSQVH